jgi:hypothetical protein
MRNSDGVAKIPPYGVRAFFQDLDILVVSLHRPKKRRALVDKLLA